MIENIVHLIRTISRKTGLIHLNAVRKHVIEELGESGVDLYGLELRGEAENRRIICVYTIEEILTA